MSAPVIWAKWISPANNDGKEMLPGM